MRKAFALLLVLGGFNSAFGLDPRKALTQYSKTTWTQQQGLPQDMIRAITQTTDGYLWVGTDEGLARFDGYEFVIFNKDNCELPSNSVTALASSSDGSLWIGTRSGLTQYRNGHFGTYNRKDGLPDDSVSSLFTDDSGNLWVVAGGNLSRFDGAKFTNFLPGRDLPMSSARAVTEDRGQTIYVAGNNSVARLENGKFVNVFESSTLKMDRPSAVQVDKAGNLWIMGVRGLIERSPARHIRRYGVRNGLPDSFGINALWADRDGNIWVGTDDGVARLEDGHFRTRTDEEAGERGSVRCLFEDREGNLWIGSNNGLARFRDDVFTIYSQSEGLPSDATSAVYQDHSGKIWVGFPDGRLMLISGGKPRLLAAQPGMPKGRVYLFRETRAGELLVSARDGLARLQGGRFRAFVPPDPQGRKSVFDALEDADGRIWLALSNGLGELRGNQFRTVIPGGQASLEASAFYTLANGADGSLWAGSARKGLWRVNGNQMRQYTTADGLGSDQIRFLYGDADDTLWIGTFGGGLNALRNKKFVKFTAKDGLLSDNVTHITDDGKSLWLCTTRGICRVPKTQLWDFAEHRIKTLQPVNYGVPDGLRSAVCLCSDRNSDGSLWFATNRGLAVYHPHEPARYTLPPLVHVVEISGDGRKFDGAEVPQMPPGSGRLQIRYTAIHLSAPERVQYSYKLDGLDSDWVEADDRRTVNYNSLKHGHYRFTVKAELPGGPSNEASCEFILLPQFYETRWFRLLCGMILTAMVWMMYQLRERQVRSRFAAVLEERARLAREVHDTLAQGFVGISSQLDVIEMCIPEDARPARGYVDLARRMARHSLTEARRSIMDLRAVALENQDLAEALESSARRWTENSGVDVEVHVKGHAGNLPEEAAHHVLRIAQEAVTNALKHASPNTIALELQMEAKKLNLRIMDDGCGFEREDVFVSMSGHFGMIGMRERAERLGGELRLHSHPGKGTQVDLILPLS